VARRNRDSEINVYVHRDALVAVDVVAGDQRSRTCDLEHVGFVSQLCTHADQTINRVFRKKKMSADRLRR